MHDGYTPAYFTNISEASRSSAAVVVPIVLELLNPKSVVDVGCGVGAWAAEFKHQQVAEVIGVDGPYVNAEDLAIAPQEFISADLTKPLDLDRKFDLAVSLEVAEHLPEEAADLFIDTLTRLAPAIVFSAAVPHQGGEDHVNEQWPNYWASRFAERGYKTFEVIRERIWNDSRVQWWYAQNTLVFATGDAQKNIKSHGYSATEPEDVRSLIHPGNYQHQAWRNRVLQMCVDLTAIVEDGARLILSDENLCGEIDLGNRKIIPFIEKNGAFGGPPKDENTALDELLRQIALGANYFAFAWPAFWQLEHYPALKHHLHSEHRQILKNDDVIVFELKS